MFDIEGAVEKILTDGIPVRVEIDPLSATYLCLALFVALFGALTLWSAARVDV